MTGTRNNSFGRRIGRAARILLLFVALCQMGIGILYMLLNLGREPSFGETAELLDAGRTFVFDDRTGFLYPLLLACGDLTGRLLRIPGILPVQFLQLVATLLSFRYLLRQLMGKKVVSKGELWLAALFLWTVMPLMQLQLSGLPYALVLSLYCVQAGVLKAMQDPAAKKPAQGRQVFLLLLLLLAEEGMMPRAGVVGLILLGICLGGRKISGSGVKRAALLLFLFLCCQLLLGATVLKPGNRGKMQNSVTATAASHIFWSRLGPNYFFWPEEIKQVFSVEDAIEATNVESKVLTVLGYRVDRAYGTAKARELYLDMAISCLRVRTREVMTEEKDLLLDYFLMPVAILRNLKGFGRSLTGWNVERFLEYTPGTGRLYLYFGLMVLPLGWILAGARRLAETGDETKTKNETVTGRTFPVRAVLLFFAALLLTTAGTCCPFDYKMGAALWLLLFIPVALGLLKHREE